MKIAEGSAFYTAVNKINKFMEVLLPFLSSYHSRARVYFPSGLETIPLKLVVKKKKKLACWDSNPGQPYYSADTLIIMLLSTC